MPRIRHHGRRAGEGDAPRVDPRGRDGGATQVAARRETYGAAARMTG
uniref:Uncharacterized protein n=1 Tax=Arundo donax TaxID=35708 RepID=A0A0A9CF53_ARUDO